MKSTKSLLYSIIFAHTLTLFFACESQKKSSEISPDEAKQIAKEAFIFGFPLVVNYKTVWNYTLNKESGQFKSDFNVKSCDSKVWTPKDKAVVSPNSDTPYCIFWADISQEPTVLSVPKMDENRYYSFQLIDLYTHNFGYVGSLTTGIEAGNYLIAKEGWMGEKPEGITDIIYCETDYFQLIARTQLFNSDDIVNVQNIQAEYAFSSLSDFLGVDGPEQKVYTDFPAWNEGDQFTSAAFVYLDFMMEKMSENPLDAPIREKMMKIGIGAEGAFSMDNFSPEVQTAIEDGVKEGLDRINSYLKEISSDPLVTNKFFGTRDYLTKSAKENYNQDNPYLIRSCAAQLGLYGNSGHEAIYPSFLVDADGNAFDASKNNYTITFKKGQEPPVRAFWSMTMYDGQTQLLVDNPLDRYLLNTTTKDDWVYADDGSLTFYLQHESPGKELENNWLPAPDGPFYAVLRLYGPKDEALSGAWTTPALVKKE